VCIRGVKRCLHPHFPTPLLKTSHNRKYLFCAHFARCTTLWVSTPVFACAHRKSHITSHIAVGVYTCVCVHSSQQQLGQPLSQSSKQQQNVREQSSQQRQRAQSPPPRRRCTCSSRIRCSSSSKDDDNCALAARRCIFIYCIPFSANKKLIALSMSGNISST
jgi:hypothetical protein